MTEGNVLEIKTVQIAPFRTLMTALKDILLETNIVFKPDGIRIVNLNLFEAAKSSLLELMFSLLEL